jgi:hypothetical protein
MCLCLPPSLSNPDLEAHLGGELQHVAGANLCRLSSRELYAVQVGRVQAPQIFHVPAAVSVQDPQVLSRDVLVAKMGIACASLFSSDDGPVVSFERESVSDELDVFRWVASFALLMM